jgi:hypothetical protein
MHFRKDILSVIINLVNSNMRDFFTFKKLIYEILNVNMQNVGNLSDQNFAYSFINVQKMLICQIVQNLNP